jgi:type I site-specific restriction endonuclease
MDKSCFPKEIYAPNVLVKAGWDIESQVLEEVSFTDDKIFVRGKLTARGKRKRADYILYYKPNIPIAITEAKNNNHSVRSGLQQDESDRSNILSGFRTHIDYIHQTKNR